jgi:hypothetical protein
VVVGLTIEIQGAARMAIETIIAAWAWDNFGKELLENLGDVSKKWTEGFTWKGTPFHSIW